MKAVLLLIAAAGSGALVTLSLPAWSVHWLAWFALVPLLFSLRQVSVPWAGALGFAFGAVLGGGSFFWVVAAIPDVNALRFGLMMVIFGAYYGVFGALYAAANRCLGRWLILAAPALWVACEYARGSLGFLAYPWNFLAHSQHESVALIQIADLTGAYGVSFILVMVNQLLSELVDPALVRRWRVPAIATAVALAATLAYGWRALSVEPQAEKLRVSVVQANVTTRNGMTVKEQMQHLAAYERLTQLAVAEHPDLIVWPSSSLPGPLSFWMIGIAMSDIAGRAGAPILVGGAGGDKFAPPREGQLAYSNSEILVSPKGTPEGQYNKVHLTPFTEQVPLQGLVTWPRWLTTLEKSFVAGDGYTLFQVRQARFGAPICWENSFPDLFRRFVLAGANFMVSPTNEAVFGPTAGPRQTLAMNAFRAVENRVAVARAATTGISAFIDSRGRIVAKVADERGDDLFVSGLMTWDVPLSAERSFYTRFGDVFAQAAALGAVLALVLAAWLSHRNRLKNTP
jgi:apolipoprotein N-acyltransferase